MRVLILTHGSRGDTEPFAALSRALIRSGHEVTIGAPREWRSIVEPNATRSVLFPDRLHEAAKDPRVREGVSNNFRGVQGKKNLMARIRLTRQARVAIFHDFESIADIGFDVLVYHGLLPGGRIAEKLEIPAIPVGLAPGNLPTRECPFIAFPFPIPRILNRPSYLWLSLRDCLLLPGRRGDIFRMMKTRRSVAKKTEYRSVDSNPKVGLQCFSSYLWPSLSDSRENLVTTGYWFLPKSRNWQPPQKLKQFIDSGPTPIYIGFGSVVGNSERISRTILEAVNLAGVRAIIGAGWESVQIDEKEDIFVLDDAPFEWLFPMMSVIVHHGGIGTIGAALRSGRPQVIFPANRATRFYARRVHCCGVGYFPQRYSELSASNLSNSIRAASVDTNMINRASEVGEKVRSIDGVETAVRIIEKCAMNRY